MRGLRLFLHLLGKCFCWILCSVRVWSLLNSLSVVMLGIDHSPIIVRNGKKILSFGLFYWVELDLRLC